MADDDSAKDDDGNGDTVADDIADGITVAGDVDEIADGITVVADVDDIADGNNVADDVDDVADGITVAGAGASQAAATAVQARIQLVGASIQPDCSEAYYSRLSFRSKSKDQQNERRAGLSSSNCSAG